MRGPRIVGAGATLLVLIGAAVLATGPAAAQDQSPSPGPSAATSASAVMPLPMEASGTLPAGRYSDTSLGIPIELDLGEGWLLAGAPLPGIGFALVREEAGEPYFALATFDGTVFDAPCRTEENAATFGTAAEPTEASAEGFIEHIRAHPFVTASEPVPVEVAGLSGLAIDVSVDVPDECDPPFALLWALPDPVGEYHLAAGQVARLLALQNGEDVIVSSSEVFSDGDLAAFVELTDAILDSIEVAEAG
jgi:hypothetical protein